MNKEEQRIQKSLNNLSEPKLARSHAFWEGTTSKSLPCDDYGILNHLKNIFVQRINFLKNFSKRRIFVAEVFLCKICFRTFALYPSPAGEGLDGVKTNRFFFACSPLSNSPRPGREQ